MQKECRTLYKIWKFYAKNGEQATLVKGMKNLTLDEAKEYCSKEDTRKAGVWFCGFKRQ